MMGLRYLINIIFNKTFIVNLKINKKEYPRTLFSIIATLSAMESIASPNNPKEKKVIASAVLSAAPQSNFPCKNKTREIRPDKTIIKIEIGTRIKKIIRINFKIVDLNSSVFGDIERSTKKG